MPEKSIKQLFDVADSKLICNTSYPVFPELYKQYQSNQDILLDDTDMSFYVHIPFCRQLCRFCEYTRFLARDEQVESHYLDLLEAQMKSFASSHNIHKIYGFDIGGGTPTSLSEKNFLRLLQMHVDFEASYLRVPDYEKSIEISFSTITEDKIRHIAHAGFKRVSAGMQSMNKKLMEKNNRYFSNIDKIINIHNLLLKYGIKKLNIDLMYGMVHQDELSIQDTLGAIQLIQPEQVTLYEMRFNQNQIQSNGVTRESQFKQYKMMYKMLQNMGYSGRFGKNTFSRVGDKGVSSYLYYRMQQGIPYKGFGIAAQSMGSKGLSYGILKGSTEKNLPQINEITEGDNYLLPKAELASKYISIAMYNGSFRLDALARILGEEPITYFKKELTFLLQHDLMTQQGQEMVVTEKGFRYYGAITALFWSKDQKDSLLYFSE